MRKNTTITAILMLGSIAAFGIVALSRGNQKNGNPTTLPPKVTNNKKYIETEKYCKKNVDCAPSGCCNEECYNTRRKSSPVDMCEKTCYKVATCKCINNSCERTGFKSLQTPPTTKADCIRVGGKLQSTDNPENPSFCNLPTSDGGKICTDSSQCESFCEAPEGTIHGDKTTGKCYGWKSAAEPCVQMVEKGIAEPPMCY